MSIDLIAPRVRDRAVVLLVCRSLARDKPLELRRLSRISGAREIKIEAVINFGIEKSLTPTQHALR